MLEVISRDEYMTFGMQGKDISQPLSNIRSSAMYSVFKHLRLHRIIDRVKGTYNQESSAYTSIRISIFLTQKFAILRQKSSLNSLI